MKHTPAPWKVNKQNATVYCTRKQYGEINEPAICKAGDTLKFEECLANARLIAAAPELLEALKEMMSSYEAVMAFAEPHQNIDYVVPKPVKEMGWERWEAARAAIAKAEG